MVDKHIVAFGGARPVASGMHPLYNYVLSMTGKSRPKVCCIPTATGDLPANLVRFYSNFPSSLCEPSHLALFGRTVTDIREYLLEPGRHPCAGRQHGKHAGRMARPRR